MKFAKSILTLFFTLVYLLSSTGVALSIHYCHDELSSVSYILADSHCMCEASDEEMTCCSTEDGFFQLGENTQHAPSTNSFDLGEIEALDITTDYFAIEEEDNNRFVEGFCVLDEIPIYLRSSALLYYG